MMKRDDPDADLRQAFADLRAADSATAPSYAALMAGRAGPRRAELVPLLGTTLAAAALAASLAVGLAVRRRAESRPPMAAIAAWTAPTDFLLRTPGREVLATVPRLVPGRALLAAGVPSLPDPKRRSPSP
jgi:hypothetical protein